MTKPSEHKTVQVCILTYAQEVGWMFELYEMTELWRSFITMTVLANLNISDWRELYESQRPR